MKKLISTALFLIFCTLTASSKPMNIGFIAGLAIPNEQVSQFFNDYKRKIELDTAFKLQDHGYYILQQATSLGYIIGVRGRIGLSDKIDFVAGISIVRFNQGKYNLTIPRTDIQDSTFLPIQSTTNVVPINLGINAYLFKSFLGVYGTANVTYNYISYSYDFQQSEVVAVPIKSSEQYSRLGFDVGAGLDLDLSLLKINFEAKYNVMNIIGRTGDEPTKKYGTFTLGVVF